MLGRLQPIFSYNFTKKQIAYALHALVNSKGDKLVFKFMEEIIRTSPWCNVAV